MSQDSDRRGAAQHYGAAVVCGGVSVVVGVLVLLGWLLGIPLLKSVLPGLVTMKANTALAFALAGGALVLLAIVPPTRTRMISGRALASVVALIGGLTLAEYAFGANFGIDQLLFREAPGAIAVVIPGRMAPTTALCFVLTGAALTLINSDWIRGFRPAEASAGLLALIGLVSLTEYAAGVEIFFSWARYTPMALHTAALFIVLAAGVALARPERGIVGLVRSEGNRDEWRVYLTLVGSLCLLLIACVVAYAGLAQSVALTRTVSADQEARRQVVSLFGDLQDIETGSRGYVITGDVSYLQPYEVAMSRAEGDLASLKASLVGDTGQAKRAEQLTPLVRERISIARTVVETRQTKGFEPAVKLVDSGQGKQVMDSIRAVMGQIDSAALEVLDSEQVKQSAVNQRVRGVLGGVAVLALVTVVLTLAAIHGDFKRRKLVGEQITSLNAELMLRAQRLTVANDELEAFAYSVSHDLRAPLRAIDGFSLALAEDYAPALDDTANDYISRVRAATQRMGDLIDDLLALSRVSRAELVRREVDLSAMAREIADDLAASDSDRAVELTIADNISASADPKLIRSVLENLLGNAWKFTGNHDHARIEFGAEATDNGRAFFVKDDGAGFDMAYADKLFGVFQRLHASDEFPGTGVGLASVARIVRRHGGTVWATGEIDKGGTFFFTLDEVDQVGKG